jgi:hypothetical protein
LKEAEIVSKAVALKKKTGVYFLILGGRVDYIGMSIDLDDRLREHEVRGRKFDAYYFVECHPDDMRALETAYIKLLNPPSNTFRPPMEISVVSNGGFKYLDLGEEVAG